MTSAKTDSKPVRADTDGTDGKTDGKTDGNVTQLKPVKRAVLKWTLDGERDEKRRVAQRAVAPSGDQYTITGKGDAWKAVHTTPRGKETVLVENASHLRAYQACTKHHAGKGA